MIVLEVKAFIGGNVIAEEKKVPKFSVDRRFAVAFCIVPIGLKGLSFYLLIIKQKNKKPIDILTGLVVQKGSNNGKMLSMNRRVQKMEERIMKNGIKSPMNKGAKKRNEGLMRAKCE